MHRTFFISLLAVVLNGCFSTGINESPEYPRIDQFFSNPTSQFVIGSTDLAKVSRANPFKGSISGCSDPAAKLFFTNTGAPYTVDVLSPVSGIVAEVENCQTEDSNDQYNIEIVFARSNDEVISLNLIFAPEDGTPCSSGNVIFFNDYIKVEVGDEVGIGMVLGQLIKPNTSSDESHIEMSLKVSGTTSAFCPNIFTTTIEETFGGLFGIETCQGTPFPNTFCFRPSDSEDLTGL